MEAVVYTSNTGSTEHYAKLLGHELRVSVYSTEEAGNKLPTGTEIIYLGWIMAGKIQRFGLARKKYKICAVCAVGMGQTGTQRKEIREKNNIPGKIPVFTLFDCINTGRYGEASMIATFIIAITITVNVIFSILVAWKGRRKRVFRTEKCK